MYKTQLWVTADLSHTAASLMFGQKPHIPPEEKHQRVEDRHQARCDIWWTFVRHPVLLMKLVKKKKKGIHQVQPIHITIMVDNRHLPCNTVNSTQVTPHLSLCHLDPTVSQTQIIAWTPIFHESKTPNFQFHILFQTSKHNIQHSYSPGVWQMENYIWASSKNIKFNTKVRQTQSP